METGNYVSRLNEFAQKSRSELKYEQVGAVGSDHNKTFIQRAVLDGKVYPEGVGKTKKEAKLNAAKNALQFLLENGLQDSTDITENPAEASAAPVQQISVSDINYICWLNEYGQKNRVSIRAVESTKPGLNNTTHFVVGDDMYPAATGKTKREAKEEAAKLVYDVICGSKPAEAPFDSDKRRTSAHQTDEFSQSISDICNKIENIDVTSDTSFTETNYIGIVNHYCQKTSSSFKVTDEGRCGPSHNPTFFCKLVINNKDYPVGEGKSVKEAKQNAARLAWSALQEQSDWDSKVSVKSTVSEDGAPAEMSVSTNDSIVFTNSSNAAEAQIPFSSREDDAPTSSGVFTSLSSSSMDQYPVRDVMPNGAGNGRNHTSAQSRFTADFDSMERLGRGAFGCVYKVKHKLVDKYYAVKIVRSQEKSLREVATLSDLHHPNIVRYYTFWMEDSGAQWKGSSDSSSSSSFSSDNSSAKYLYIQMELCSTKTLKVWIDERNTRRVPDTKRGEKSLSIAQQIVSGVEYIHSQKHIHRDLKPANILFGLDKRVKIGDFGLVTRDDAMMDKTQDKGTPTYMAPEQRGKNYDRRVDIFPLGLIYLELLWKIATGHERGMVLHDARRQRLPKEFSLAFPQENKIIMSMLREKPEDRPEASTLKAELDKWAQIFSTQKVHQESKTF